MSAGPALVCPHGGDVIALGGVVGRALALCRAAAPGRALLCRHAHRRLAEGRAFLTAPAGAVGGGGVGGVEGGGGRRSQIRAYQLLRQCD